MKLKISFLLLFMILGVFVSVNQVVLAAAGDVSVSRAADDAESRAGIIIAGREEVLAKFRFTATNEDMTVNKMQISVGDFFNAHVAAVGVPIIKLYDGATQVGKTFGYPVTDSGVDAGIVFIDDLNWRIPRDSSKTLTVKGVLSTIARGARFSSISVAIMNTGFEAQGFVTKDTTIQFVFGDRKIVYKTKPTISIPTQQPLGKLGVGETPVLRFRIAADSTESVSWKKLTFRVSMTGASMSAVDVVPGTTGNVKVMDLNNMIPLNIANASGGPIPGGSNGLVSIVLANEERISAGSRKDYEVAFNFVNLQSVAGSAYAFTQIALVETDVVGGVTFADVERSGASFIWSDNSAVAHSETSFDWANGRYVSELPSSQVVIANGPGGGSGASLCAADVNGDSVVNIIDLVTIARKFGQSVSVGSRYTEDVNNDGRINIVDLVAVARKFGQRCDVSAYVSQSEERVVFIPVSVTKQSQNTGFASVLKSIFWVIGE